jgi:hypothetical protein
MAVAVTIFLSLVVWRRFAGPTVVLRPSALVFQIFVGLTLSALPLLIIRLRTRRLYRLAPGDFLWIACASERCIFLLLALGVRSVDLGDWAYRWDPIFMCLAVGACYTIPVLFAKQLWWRLVGLSFVLWYLYACIGLLVFDDFMLLSNRGLSIVFALVAMAVAIIIDWNDRRRHAWSHWCGVLVFVCWIAVEWWPLLRWLMRIFAAESRGV